MSQKIEMPREIGKEGNQENLVDQWNAKYIQEHGEPLKIGSPGWLVIANTDVTEIVSICFYKNYSARELCSMEELLACTWKRLAVKMGLPQTERLESGTVFITRAFIYKAAGFCLRDIIRQKLADKKLAGDGLSVLSVAGSTDLLNYVTDGAGTPSGIIIEQERRQELWEILERVLNERDLLLVILRHFLGCSFRDMAMLFDSTEHYLRSRHAQIKTILKPAIADKFPTRVENERRLGQVNIDSRVQEFVVMLGKYALQSKWDEVTACLADWLQDELTPADVQEFFARAYASTLAEHGITEAHAPEGTEPEVGGTAFMTADGLRKPIDWLGDRTRRIPHQVTNENMRFWASLSLLGSETQSQQLKFDTFAEIWMAVVETDKGLRVGYWSHSAYEV